MPVSIACSYLLVHRGVNNRIFKSETFFFFFAARSLLRVYFLHDLIASMRIKMWIASQNCIERIFEKSINPEIEICYQMRDSLCKKKMLLRNFVIWFLVSVP